MPDKKLIYDKLPDGEIKKVLECCLYGDCQDCFYGGTDQRCCGDDLMQNCLDYFTRLQAENEELVGDIDKLKVEIKELHTKNLILSQKRFNIFEKIEFSDKLKGEAYKKVFEKLNEKAVVKKVKIFGGLHVVKVVTLHDINALKKEMVGEDDGKEEK